MPAKLSVLPTDAMIYLLVLCALAIALWIYFHPHLHAPWRAVGQRRVAMVSLVIALSFSAIGFLDCIHFRLALPKTDPHASTYYSPNVTSVLDLLLGQLGKIDEESYSAPFATHLYTQAIVNLPDGTQTRTYPRLVYGGRNLADPIKDRANDIQKRLLIGVAEGLIITLLLQLLFVSSFAHRHALSFWQTIKNIYTGKTAIAWREILITLTVVTLFVTCAANLAQEYHIFGTDKVGKDIFYETIKSIRTGLVIGTLATLIMLPFAVLLGLLAGYFGGWLDDAIQYLYTTLNSIPGVLLITAAILAIQVYIENHPEQFTTLAIRADIRLLALCIILGITSWTTLCRLLRAETLKLRETDFVQAAIAFGCKRRTILLRHLLPNVLHIVLITIVLDFSSLVLAEAVLSYVGVGVDPTTISWGNMINSARLELAREPVVWWPLLAAFIFMFALVLSANLFADAVRDAFDPRLKDTQS